MRWPWQEKCEHGFCSKCGSKMGTRTERGGTRFDPCTGEEMVQVRPVFVCTWGWDEHFSWYDLREDGHDISVNGKWEWVKVVK